MPQALTSRRQWSWNEKGYVSLSLSDSGDRIELLCWSLGHSPGHKYLWYIFSITDYFMCRITGHLIRIFCYTISSRNIHTHLDGFM